MPELNLWEWQGHRHVLLLANEALVGDIVNKVTTQVSFSFVHVTVQVDLEQ